MPREPLWELIGLTKAFPGVLANDAVSLRIFPGEVHGIVGENGSGKSTFVKMLSGALQPDSGEIQHQGRRTVLRNPVDARRQGIATVFQEFSLIATLSVAENIQLGRWPRRRGTIDWTELRRRAVVILDSLELDIDPDALVSELSVGRQQLVEITKSISLDASLIILDEPTTALGSSEIKSLHSVLRRLRQNGRAILYISHRLDELLEIVDAVTVLKDGKVVSEAMVTHLDVGSLVRSMIGTDLPEHYPKQANVRPDVLLEVSGITTANRVHDVSFHLHRGEVLGLAGVLGSGRTEMARALFGVDPLVSGSIAVEGRPVHIASPADAIRAKVAFVPENRKTEGLFFNFSGTENITAASLRGLAKRGVLRLGKEKKVVGDLIMSLRITPDAVNKTVGLLSGGNQQKVIIARWLLSGAEVFLLDEPTQGIDVGAKRAVYELINELTRSGKGVILISSDHDELLALSDRVAIVRNGTIRDIVAAKSLNKDRLVQSFSQLS
jgi:ABC-type sugar transport system ATPase subunit